MENNPYITIKIKTKTAKALKDLKKKWGTTYSNAILQLIAREELDETTQILFLTTLHNYRVKNEALEKELVEAGVYPKDYFAQKEKMLEEIRKELTVGFKERTIVDFTPTKKEETKM